MRRLFGCISRTVLVLTVMGLIFLPGYFIILPALRGSGSVHLPGGDMPATPGGGRDQTQILRFHVRAASNSIPDQRVKNQVASGILQHYFSSWYGCVSREELFCLLAEEQEAIGEKAQEILRRHGFDEEVCVRLGKSKFPARLYGNKYYPPGEYDALVVVIGAGKGENWWCVLFPPLCFNVLPAPDSAETKAAADAAENKERLQEAEGAEDIEDTLLAEAESVHNKHDGTEHSNRQPAKGKGEKRWRLWLIDIFKQLF